MRNLLPLPPSQGLVEGPAMWRARDGLIHIWHPTQLRASLGKALRRASYTGPSKRAPPGGSLGERASLRSGSFGFRRGALPEPGRPRA